jgi:PAS domain S-box-containing protein
MKHEKKTKKQLIEDLEALRSEIDILRKAEPQPSHIEEDLHEIQEHYGFITDHMLDAMVIIDWEGNFLYANKATFSLVGLEMMHDLSSLNIFQFIAPEDQQTTRENLLKTRKGKEPYLSLYKIITRDGQERWIEGLGKKIIFQNREADLLTIRDVTERKLFEEQILLSEKKFAVAFLSSPAPMVITSPENGEIIDVNQSFDRWSGYSRDELIGFTTLELGFWLDVEDRHHMVEELGAKGTVDALEIRFRIKGGGIRDVLYSARFIELDDKPFILSYCNDITERRQAEEALKERQARVDSIFRAAPTGIGVVSNRILLEVNDRICDMTGYSREELVGNSARMLYPTQEEFDFVGSEKYRQIQAMGTGSVETRWMRKDGAIIDIILSSTPIVVGDLSAGVTFTALDITERKRIDEELKESEERYRRITSAVTDYIFTVHVEGGHAVRTIHSPACEAVTGYTVEEFNRDPYLWFNMVMEEDKEKVRDHVSKILAGNNIGAIEHRIRCKEGTVRWVINTPVLHLDSSGALISYDGVLSDITSRKLAEVALRESEQKLQMILHDFPISTFVLDKNHRVIHWNEALEQLSKIRAKDIIGTKGQWRAFYSDERPCMADLIIDQATNAMPEWYSEKYEKSRLIDEAYEATDFFSSLGEAGKWLRFTAAPIRNSVGELIGAIETLEDITERKKAEEALRESEERYRGIASNLPGVVYQFYARDNGEMGLYYVSERSQELLGLDSSLQDFFPQFTACVALEDRERFLTSIQEVVRSISKWEFEGRFIKPAGEEMYVRGISQPKQLDNEIVFNGVMLDVTDRKHAERALKESEERFRSLIQSSSDIIVIMDEKGLITYETPSVERVLGYKPGDLIGKTPVDHIHPDDLDKVMSALDEVYKANNPGTPTEFRFCRADSTWIYLEAIGKNLLDFPGINGVVITARDITDRKKSEEERIEMERRLLHAQKLESLGVMAGGIAHDFNNLLMAILGNLDLALLDLSPVSRPRPFIDQALKAARRAADLTNQMLAYSGKGRFDLKVFDMSELVEEMARLLKASISKTVTLNLQMARDLQPIMADPGQIQQIVMNLIVNASEAIGDQTGIVTITTGMQECDEKYLMQSRLKEKPPPGMYVFFEVKDTGCGMDGQTQERLFDPFFTTKFTGRGLGMAAALGIVSGHRGAIVVESEPGRGTRIRVLFPASGKVKKTTRERKKDAADGNSGLDLPHSAGAVLVVDDEEMVRNLCKSMVERFGYLVMTASDGEEAVALFREHADEIACVILDLTMPNKDGMATFEELQRIRGDIKVIISSGFDEQEVTQRFVGKELAGIIKKPYQLENIRSELIRVLEG